MADVMTDTPTQHIMNTSANLSNVSAAQNVDLLLTQDAMQPEIKSEPAEDIDDCMGYDDSTNSNEALTCSTTNTTPKIRLTPTSKLLASPTQMDPKRKFICPYENCTKSYGKSSHLRSHLTWHTGIKPFVCKEVSCGKGFTRSDELNRHMRTHTGEKPFECVQCSKKFSRSDHLTKHLGTHAKQMQNNKSKTEKAASVKKTSLPLDHVVAPNIDVTPTIDVKPNIDVTPNINVSPNIDVASNNHMVTPNMDIVTPNMDFGLHFMAAAASRFTNNKCNTKPDTRKLILRKQIDKPVHIKKELSDEEINDEEDDDDLIVPDYVHKRTKVPVKDEPITQKYDDTQHVDDDAIVPEVNFVLPVTPSVANTNNMHMVNVKPELVFSSERPHQCKECLRSFKRHDDLNRHMRTHTGFKPYSCNQCEKCFLRSDHLKKHLITHSKKKV